MRLTEYLTDRSNRENLKEKFEVIMAVWVIGAYAYKKMHSNSPSSIQE